MRRRHNMSGAEFRTHAKALVHGSYEAARDLTKSAGRGARSLAVRAAPHVRRGAVAVGRGVAKASRKTAKFSAKHAGRGMSWLGTKMAAWGTRENPYKPISHGFYRVSDAEAGKLARGVGKPLPSHGRELRVELPDGKLAWLSRTPYSPRNWTDAPKRGWVWSVSGISEKRSNPFRLSRKVARGWGVEAGVAGADLFATHHPKVSVTGQKFRDGAEEFGREMAQTMGGYHPIDHELTKAGEYAWEEFDLGVSEGVEKWLHENYPVFFHRRSNPSRRRNPSPAPSAKALKGAFRDLSMADAVRLNEMMRAATGHKSVDRALETINQKIGGYGIEAINGSKSQHSYYLDAVALYVNTGDVYNTTVLYNIDTRRFYLTTVGDFVEKNEKRYGIK